MSMMRKRIIAIVAAALAIVILGVTLAGVLQYVDTMVFVDVDETKYYARKVKNEDGNSEYRLFADWMKKRQLQKEEAYGCYVTDAGTLVKLDAETGEASVYAVVETSGNEALGFGDRVLIFPHTEKKNILSLEVNNEHGSFTFHRVNESLEQSKDGSTFVIKGSPLTAYNEELFAELYVGAGYALSVMRLENPIKRTADGALCPHAPLDENGEPQYKNSNCDCSYSEYGLVSETREREVEDEDGKTVTEAYEYKPAYYILTNLNGVKYKVIVGDALVTGGGYYVQYVDMSGESEAKRDAVYVIDNSSGTALTSPIETYVSPMLCYPMTMNSYFDVENFVISNRVDGDKITYDEMISFTYVDLSERENTMAATTPYNFKLDLEGYSASDTAINNCLYNLYSPALTRTVKFAPTDKDLVDYGFFIEKTNEKGETEYEVYAKHVIRYKYDVPTDNTDIKETIEQTILISDKDYATTGKYYTFTMETVTVTDKSGNEVTESYTYNFIVEAEGYTFDFLSWDQFDWVDTGYVNANIAFVQSIKINGSGYSANYIFDNSLSNKTGAIDSSFLFVNAAENGGASRDTFSRYDIYDSRTDVYYHWVISSSDIKVYKITGIDANGNLIETEQKINNDYAFYDYNALDNQVLCRTGRISGLNADGEAVEVEISANYVTVYKGTDGDASTYDRGAEKKDILRYDTDLFRKFYQTLLYGSLEGSYTLTDEEEAAITTDSGLLLTIEIKLKDAESAGGKEYTNVYKFYKIPGSSRKAYITVNGNGGFYVYKTKVEKFISDSQKFFKNEIIVPDTRR